MCLWYLARMGYPVQVYIYDLSQGMARQMGQAIIGRPIEGIWHTAVVVHGQVTQLRHLNISFHIPKVRSFS